jgi:hypothetical protein
VGGGFLISGSRRTDGVHTRSLGKAHLIVVETDEQVGGEFFGVRHMQQIRRASVSRKTG